VRKLLTGWDCADVGCGASFDCTGLTGVLGGGLSDSSRSGAVVSTSAYISSSSLECRDGEGDCKGTTWSTCIGVARSRLLSVNALRTRKTRTLIFRQSPRLSRLQARRGRVCFLLHCKPFKNRRYVRMLVFCVQIGCGMTFGQRILRNNATLTLARMHAM
jgi:hypothetical protein